MGITIKEVDSTIRSVTVYQGWAMITRRAATHLEAGKQLIVFADLPASLDRDNIQVKGTGEATLGECIFETEFFVEDVDANRRQLQKQVLELEDRIAEIQLEIVACESETAFMKKIAEFVTTPISVHASEGNVPRAVGGTALDVDAWKKMLAFYHEQNGTIGSQMLALKKAERGLNNELEKIYSELDSLGDRIERSRNIIKVSVAQKTAGDITLDLTYVVSGPTWRPVYNLRASSDSDTIGIEYDALVNQATGEAWQDVVLKLSTARVNVSGVVPILTPWRLAFEPPFQAMNVARKKRSTSKEDEIDAEMIEEAPCKSASAPPEPVMEMDVDEASVESGGTSVVFSVSGGGNISGDNTDTRVSILRREFPAKSHYATVPKLSPFAYLTTKIENNSDFPLLPGKANIFFDDAFVSVSAFSLVMPGQEIEVSLGVDEGIKIEHRLLKRFKKNQGLVSKRISEQLDYQIRITNNRKKDMEIDVFDQLPITQDKEISVKAIKPAFKDEKDSATLDDESKIKWEVSLSAGEKRELPLSFIVEYPIGRHLYGF